MALRAAVVLPSPVLATMITVPVPDMNQSPLGEIKVWADDMIPDVEIPDSTPDGKGPRYIKDDRTGAILARFQHNKASNSEAAKAAWGGHFQWVNIVTGETGDHPRDENGEEVKPPYIDPLPGRSSIFIGDRLPFFWDEKDPIPSTPQFEGDTPNDADLDFGDGGKDGLPEFVDAPRGGADEMVEFETWLVAVPGDVGQMDSMEFHLLAGFKWKVNEGGADEGDESIPLLMPLDPLSPRNVTSALERFNGKAGALARSGFGEWTATTHLPVSESPEPGTFALMGLGLAGLAWRRRKVMA